MSGTAAWEYEVVEALDVAALDESLLNEKGALGWELCGVRHAPSQASYGRVRMYFKRPRAEQKEVQ